MDSDRLLPESPSRAPSDDRSPDANLESGGDDPNEKSLRAGNYCVRHRGRVLILLLAGIVLAFIRAGASAVPVGVSLAVVLKPATAPSTELRFPNAAVATEEITCSEIGRDILLLGGNAVDAAVASTLCIGVINNFASGIGGGGFMLISGPELETPVFIDFRERAPAGAYKDMFVDYPELATSGGLASGVPGELRGLELAHGKYGKLPWADVFQPAINMARNGFQVTPLLETRLKTIEELCLTDPRWSEVYAPLGRLARVGETIYRTKLADVLETIAQSGSADPFYHGEIAKTIVRDLKNTSGIITEADMASYKAVERAALRTEYRGRVVYTGEAPSSGPVLLFLLNVLENYDLRHDGQSIVTFQRIVEAMKFGYAQRSYLGDPDCEDDMFAIIEHMINQNFADEVYKNITDNTVHNQSYYGGEYEVQETPGTTHVSALDKSGLAVSLTSTVNLVWGSKLMTENGIIMNNQMDDFSTPGKPNAFNLWPSPNNYIKPGKRPLSSSTPTIIFNNGQVELVVGASGGSRIITATLMTILNALDFGLSIQAAVDAPRVHEQLYPDDVTLEYEFSTKIADGLEAIGQVISRLDPGVTQSAVQAIRRGTDGYIYPASDPRKNGLAAGY